jgi:hypothetical protein
MTRFGRLVIATLVAGCGGDSGDDTPTDPVETPELDCALFPADNPWNTDISGAALHPRSADYIDSIGADDNLHPDFGTVFDGAPNGIPFVAVGGGQALVDVSFETDDESDPGPYPIPADAPIEGGPNGDGDRHVIVVDDDACVLYELFAAFPDGDGWRAFSGARFDLGENALRPDGFTSADAAGLPILPGLVRYDQVVGDGAINHALRVTVPRTQAGFIHPATHEASSDTDPTLPPMGLRLRLRPDFDCSGFSDEVQVMCAAMQTYGMFVADHGSAWFVSGVPDPRWSDGALRDLRMIPGSAFEAVDSGPIIAGQ